MWPGPTYADAEPLVGSRYSYIFIPHGVYLISDTIDVEIGLQVVGECWSQLMAKGSSFSGLSSPKVFIRVGLPTGSVGEISLSDLLITTKGVSTHFAGVEWNVRDGTSDSTPYAGMYGGFHPISPSIRIFLLPSS